MQQQQPQHVVYQLTTTKLKQAPVEYRSHVAGIFADGPGAPALTSRSMTQDSK